MVAYGDEWFGNESVGKREDEITTFPTGNQVVPTTEPDWDYGKTLSDINHSRILYDRPPRLLEIKAKINKWHLIKIKSFCTTKETISKVKRQPSEWEKIIANEATDKQLISKIYKQLLQLNSRKINDPIKKWPKELNRHFSKEDIRWLTNT